MLAGLPAPPLNALERWLLLCKWHELPTDAIAEPLLPTGASSSSGGSLSSPADEALAADLRRAGMDARSAAALTKRLRADAMRATAWPAVFFFVPLLFSRSSLQNLCASRRVSRGSSRR